jgi:hypothetical protein
MLQSLKIVQRGLVAKKFRRCFLIVIRRLIQRDASKQATP